ncbi:MAG: insulinase family protein [bacterium]
MRRTLVDTAFTTHTPAHDHRILKDVEAMPGLFAYSRTFFERWYRPENVVVIAAGDLDPAALFAEAEKRYGGWARGSATPPIPAEPPQTEERRKALTWPSPTLPQVVMGFKVPAFSTTERDPAALEVLAAVVFAERAPLYRKLVLEDQTVDALSADTAQYVDPFLFTITAKVKDAANLGAVEAAIHAELARVAAEGVDEETLAEVKQRARYGFAASLATAEGVASKAAWFVSLTGRIESINAWQDQIAAVTVADLKRVAGQYFVPAAGRTVITIVPEVK